MPTNQPDLPSLFCKPVSLPYDDELLFLNEKGLPGRLISFRSLQLSTDVDLIHDWVHQEYAQAFWQFPETRDKIMLHYGELLSSPHQHSFIGQVDLVPVCLVDIYRVLADELKDHVPDAGADDTGLHFLMAPPGQRVKNLSFTLFYSFLQFYFSFPMAERLFGEPDERNEAANRIVRRCGFQFMRPISLSYKTANLYCLTKQQFHATHPID